MTPPDINMKQISDSSAVLILAAAQKVLFFLELMKDDRLTHGGNHTLCSKIMKCILCAHCKWRWVNWSACNVNVGKLTLLQEWE